MARKDDIGRWGEAVAADYLAQRGYEILEKNWRHSLGEIDIIARSNGRLVFAEVKTRTGRGYGHPFEAITTTKLDRLRRLALAWCRQHEISPRQIRIDAIAVLGVPDRTPNIEHLTGVY
ncbi:YraN family protein [Lysinibacter cavernae]|uniref:UPF0102 protein FHX76_000287 n=1 Tax=Lysinibacter cavernae TaxID=1640652 RepID=A0A7X5TSI0_9MICO|nr:YraN family protein [Lysinibacter cavernae]NIH52419.1 putative endonuclease [Lysinibacter cavernae]